MWKRILTGAITAVRNNPFAYLIVGFALLTGIACGIFYPSSMPEAEKQALIEYIRSLAYSYAQGSPDFFEVLKQSFFNNIRIIIVMTLSGFTRFGSPILMLATGFKGFGTGIIIGALVTTFGFGGFVASAIILLPQNLIYIPAYLRLGAISITRSCIKGGPPRGPVARKRYLMELMPSFYALIAGIMVESFISPFIIKLISPSLI